MKPPPGKDALLDQVTRVVDSAWWQPFLDDTSGAIAPFRGFAAALAHVGTVGGRAASRQYFVTPPGFEAADFGSAARGEVGLSRTDDLSTGLVAVAGSLIFAGPAGRLYANVDDLVWYPAPDEVSRVATIECSIAGETGNLDAWADEDGNLSTPDGGPDTGRLDFLDPSPRAGSGATLEVGPPSTLTLGAMSSAWTHSDVGLHILITDATEPANIGRLLRIVDLSIGEEPVDGIFPRTIEVDDTPQSRLASAVLLDDGGVFSDQTGAAQAGVPGSVAILPSVPAAGDALYLGGDVPFVAAEIEITARRYGDYTLAWEWWDGGSWVAAVDLDDGSVGFTIEGRATISHTPQLAWAPLTISGRTAFWLRARVDVFTSSAQAPTAGLITVLVADPLLPEVTPGGVSWAIQGWRDLGLTITSIIAPTGGRDDDLSLKLRERGVTVRPGEESLDRLRRRASRVADVVTPEAIQWEINRLLHPLGLAGEVIDLGSGFSSIYFDVPASLAPAAVGAWDLYAPGDLFPTDTTVLPLSAEESRWHFFVRLPPSGLGEFGAAWDEGPPAVFVPELGSFIGSAWDAAFLDGYPAVAAAAYAAVWRRVNEVKAAGIDFTVIRGEVAGCK